MAVPVGSSITSSQWQYPFSQLETKDLLARVIYAEDTKTTDGQAAIAGVLYNRRKNPDKYTLDHGSDNSWANIVYKGCSVAQKADANAMAPNTSSSMWTNALALGTKLAADQAVSTTVGARYYWKGSGLWPTYTGTKVNEKSYLNSSGQGTYCHNNSDTFILALDYGANQTKKFEFMKIIQTRLNDLGYSCGTPDGKQGNTTDAKIKAYQTAKGFTSDGIVGTQTWNAMLPQISQGSVNDAVKFLRARLTAKGVSGVSGTSTTFDATLAGKVKTFQSSVSLSPDGVVGMDTWRKLG